MVKRVRLLTEGASMRKSRNRVSPALKHGIYSGLGLLPTESRAKFRKFKKQMFSELNLVGRLEEDIGEEIVSLEWRRQNLFTYDLAKRARTWRDSIHSMCESSLDRHEPSEFERLVHGTRLCPETMDAVRKRADKQARAELGAAFELVELKDVATLEYLEQRLAVLERLDEMITRAYKKLAYVRAIKSIPPPPSLPPPSPPLLENAA